MLGGPVRQKEVWCVWVVTIQLDAWCPRSGRYPHLPWGSSRRRLLGSGLRVREDVPPQHGTSGGRCICRRELHRPRFSSERYGLPLTKQEENDLAVRARVREQMQPAIDVARDWPGLGGVYVDQRREGAVVFQFVDHLDAYADQLERLLPEASRYEVVKVQHNYSELLELKAHVSRRVRHLEDLGVNVVEIGPDEPTNRLVVGATGQVATAQTNPREDECGPAVVAERAALGQMDDCTRQSCRPLNGGLEIRGDLAPTDLCTSAFIAKTSGGTKRLVTAGHCVVSRIGHTWTHNGLSLGTALDPTLESNEATCGDAGHDYCADAGWFLLDDSDTPLTDPRSVPPR